MARSKSASRKSAAKKKGAKSRKSRPAAKKKAARKVAKKAAKARKPRSAAKKAAPARRKRPAAKKAVAPRTTKAPVAPPAKTAADTAAFMSAEELDNRIAIVRNNLRELVEQAASYSGASNEELASQRIAEQEATLALLIKQREELAQQGS
jgi:hypothetical protein